jgi:hypothetical protein
MTAMFRQQIVAKFVKYLLPFTLHLTTKPLSQRPLYTYLFALLLKEMGV